jgi:hypothetical protein
MPYIVSEYGENKKALHPLFRLTTLTKCLTSQRNKNKKALPEKTITKLDINSLTLAHKNYTL